MPRRNGLTSVFIQDSNTRKNCGVEKVIAAGQSPTWEGLKLKRVCACLVRCESHFLRRIFKSNNEEKERRKKIEERENTIRDSTKGEGYKGILVLQDE